MNLNATGLPNPLDPTAYLPPADAKDSEFSTYMYMVTLGALVWDWVISMPDEYTILTRGAPSLSKVAYVLSRVSSVAFCLTSVVFQVADADDCQTFIRAVGALCIPALTFNSLLILFRARAVYGHSWRMTCLFVLSWCAVVGTSFAVPFALNAEHIGPTKRCIGNRISPHLAISIITNAANNTFIFVAISYRIASLSVRGNTWNARATSFFRGDGLPAVAKDLLHGGQLCYFVTIVMSLIQAVMAFQPRYRAELNIPGIALENMMTCRVHRAVILGLITSPALPGGTQTQGPIMFTTGITSSDVLSRIPSKDELRKRDSDMGLQP
ncbi:hypothetical protein FIBSPDRAFT_834174 [Athelia psychrophila]|uniref:G-protein coupled receptors family 1 profile domain-containing protein n=1 Tax=Athelia psychrophila TaxID=1759441 RepID=A0A166D5K5_9AGAM|nr:hypothetical protein FIBSPDRAFT_1055024 [Fibularhizoctonia sp. CBS 109695]KZP14343.1 hypothetical protein FIBSPDRAFT_834174 [Fibularhizoctonia sp. CBS 109695]